jgi:hypothetical protein
MQAAMVGAMSAQSATVRTKWRQVVVTVLITQHAWIRRTHFTQRTYNFPQIVIGLVEETLMLADC